MLNYTNNLFEKNIYLKEAQTKFKLTLGYLKTEICSCGPSAICFIGFVLFHCSVDLEPAVNDALMRYFDRCERFVKEVENNKSALEEVKHFSEGPEMKRVMEKMADRLKVPYTSVTYGQ